MQYGHPNAGVWGYTEKHVAAVLWQNWRLKNGVELYDILTDSGQSRDVAAEQPDLVRRLRAHNI